MLLLFAPAGLSGSIKKRPENMDNARNRWVDILKYYFRAFAKGFAVAAFCCLLLQYFYILYVFLFLSPFFKINSIQTPEVSNKLKKEILDTVNVNLNSSKNLLEFSCVKFKQSIADNPRVKFVSISKTYPDMLTINLNERIPAFYIVSEGLFFSADNEGVILEKLTPQDIRKNDFCFITGNFAQKIDRGVQIKKQSFRESVNFISAIEQLNPAVYRDISEVQITQNDDIYIHLLSGTELRFGSKFNSNSLARLEAFIRHHGSLKSIVYVDLRFQKQIPYVKKEDKADKVISGEGMDSKRLKETGEGNV